MKTNHLIPDLTRKILIDGATLCSAPCKQRNASIQSIHLVSKRLLQETDDRVKKLFELFPSIIQPPKYQKDPKHDVYHHITTDNGPPHFEKSRRLYPDTEKGVKKSYAEMVKIGLCRFSKSQWASPIVVVKNRKNEIRIVGDYRGVNARTLPDRYPMPNLQNCTFNLANKRVFSVVDLVRAFHNIRVFPNDICKTAQTSPVGLFEYTRMPFGLKNAPATFQRFIDSILFDLDFVFCYLDDILIFSDNEEQHNEHLNILFQRLCDYGLTINLTKCKFFVEQVDFLGQHISREGFQPTSERIEFIKNLKRPNTIAALRRVLGILNFYRPFCRGAAELLASLNELLKGQTKKRDRTRINWSPNLSTCFDKAKDAFVNYTLLHFPTDNLKLLLTCDASGSAIGAVLEQLTQSGERQPLGFFSAKLNETQQKWSTYDRELYAVYAGVEHFSYLIEGHDLTLITDHKPLLYLHVYEQK